MVIWSHDGVEILVRPLSHYLGGLVVVVGDEAEASKDNCYASDQLSVVEDLELVCRRALDRV